MTRIALAFVLFASPRESAAETVPLALRQAMAKLYGVEACARQSHASIASAERRLYVVTPIHLTDGATVYRVEPTGIYEPGPAGVANVPKCRVGYGPNHDVFAYVVSGSMARQVLTTSAQFVKFCTDGSAIAFVEGGAALATLERYRYDGTSYAFVSSRSRNGTHKFKEDSVPLHFANGASSATVSGEVQREFEDSYVLEATAGQIMAIVVHPNSGKLASLLMYREAAGRLEVAPSTSGTIAWHGKLPSTGHYVLVIDGASYYAPTSYSMTVTIR